MYFKTVIALACLTVSVTLTNAQKESEDVKTVRTADHKVDVALAKSDAAALDQIVAPGYVEINTQGEMSDKGKLLEFARARKSGPVGIVAGPERTVTEQAIRMHGNMAIVLHMISTKFPPMDYQTSGPPPSQGPELVDREVRMRVYSRQGSTWQLVAQQTTFVPKR